jgi:hypothetical protein
MAIWNILWPFGILYGHLLYFVALCFGILYLKESGNIGLEASEEDRVGRV